MAERVEGPSTEVLRQQLMKATDENQRLNAQLAASLLAHNLLVEVAAVINDTESSTEASPVNQKFDPVSVHVQPGSREPRRDSRAVAAQRGFERAVDSAVRTYWSRKDNDWQKPYGDLPEDSQLMVVCVVEDCDRAGQEFPKVVRVKRSEIHFSHCPACQSPLQERERKRRGPRL